uniref:Cytochrome P450 n=1 Tax=Ditylenchus dipsaci TaxID=166011 RepID=A0A915D6J7_9BILA
MVVNEKVATCPEEQAKSHQTVFKTSIFFRGEKSVDGQQEDRASIHHTNYWRRRGIPGPQPKPFFGNMSGLAVGNYNLVVQDLFESYEKWNKLFGSFYGLQFGTKNVFVTSNPPMLKDLLVTKTACFQKLFRSTAELAIALGQRSAGQLENSEVCKYAQVAQQVYGQWKTTTGRAWTKFLKTWWLRVPFLNGSIHWLTERVALWEKNNSNRAMQLLIDLIRQEKCLEINQLKEAKHLDIVDLFQQDLMRNIGIEMSSTLLLTLLNYLAKDKNLQLQLNEEIAKLCSHDQQPTYEQLSQMKLMQAVIQEGLRLEPPSHLVVDRICVKATTLGQIPIEVGTLVKADINSVHRDPSIWGENAMEFVPHRWLIFNGEGEFSLDTEKHKLFAFLPFHAGRLMCPAYKLAILQTKISLVYLLRKFNFSCDENATCQVSKHYKMDDCCFHYTHIGNN